MYLLWTFVISLAVIIVLILSKKLNPSLCLFIGAIVELISVQLPERLIAHSEVF